MEYNELLITFEAFHAKTQRKPRKGAKKINLCVFRFSLRLCVKHSFGPNICEHLESRFRTDQAGFGALFETALPCVWRVADC